MRSCAAPLVVLLAALGLTGCEGILDPQGPVGTTERTILFDALAIMLAIIVPTSIATLAFAWWFRESNGKARFRPDFVYSGRVELVVWSIPTLVIIFLGGIIWIGSHQLDPAARLPSTADPIEVQAISLDWKWLFILPNQGIASVNTLVVPSGSPVHFVVTSASVMNTLFVPRLGGMIYAMNGMETSLNLVADHDGDYYGRSAQFSGDGFPRMQFTLHAVPADAFYGWVRSAQANGPNLDRDSYMALARQSTDVPPATFRLADSGLFHAVVSQTIPPAPGPQEGNPSPDVSLRPGG